MKYAKIMTHELPNLEKFSAYHDDNQYGNVAIRISPDFGSGSSKSEIRPFFPNPAPAKFLAAFGRRHSSCNAFSELRIKTKEADLSGDVFTILISFTCNFSIVINEQATGSKFGIIFNLLIYFIWSVSKSVWPHDE